MSFAWRPFGLALALLVGTAGFAHAAGAFTVASGGIAVSVSPDGAITGVILGAQRASRAVHAATALGGCTVAGAAHVTQLGRGVRIEQTWAQAGTANQCVLVQTLEPGADSIRWDVEVRGTGQPWTAPVETRLSWPDPARAAFWTAWGSSHPAQGGWSDPLVPAPFDNLTLTYGGADFTHADSFSIPIATVLEPTADLGLSLVQSPEDLLLETQLTTTRAGDIVLSRANLRIGSATPVRFAMDLVAHAADWRAGLGWMTTRYPTYFDPPNPKAGEISGLGAYSGWEGELDARKLLKMGFAANWKASFDFPYMGMFLPPTGGTEEYKRFGGGTTSIRKMAYYSRRMRAMGFHVLNYFNITEFGAYTHFPPPARKAKDDRDLWRDCDDFLFQAIPDGVLYDAAGKPYGSWEGAVATDCAGPKYQAFLLDQARRHVRELPASSGICIDRLDWTHLYNPRADDGVSWLGGKPARSLVVSWHDTMAKLGPIMHEAGKVIYANPLNRRLDLLRHMDGIYDEMGGMPHSLNLCSLLGVRKPVMMWTGGVADLQAGADALFQRCLYLGACPTAPLPANDHTITPDAWAEGYYLQYGSLLQALRGRKWALIPHVIEVTGNEAKANVFEVPGGYVVPVTFGGDRQSVEILLRGLRRVPGQRGWRIETIIPGAHAWRAIEARADGASLRLQVPLRRGCAMVRLSHTWMTPSERGFTGQAEVKLGTMIRGAELRYTLDDTDPTSVSPLYTKSVLLRDTATVRAAAFCDGTRITPVLMTEYVRTAPSAPTIGPQRLIFEREAEVRISAPLEDRGTRLLYTLDGTDPTAASPGYHEALRLTETTTVKARVITAGGELGPVQSVAYARIPPASPPPDVPISGLKPLKATVGWGGEVKVNRSIENRPLSIAGTLYATGMGVSAVSELVYDLRPEYKAFVAAVGIDDEMHAWTLGSVTFAVYVDGKLLCESPVLRQNDYWFINVPLPPGAKQIRLLAGDAGDNINCDHADWANAGFLVK